MVTYEEEERENRKGKSEGHRVGILNVGNLAGKTRGLDTNKRRKIGILSV